MILSRKGLSDIVTNVLIILLVLVAIGIIWAFISPFISQSSNKVQGADQCFTVSVEPVSCDDANNQIIVRRNAGEADVLKVGVQVTDPVTGLSTVFDSGVNSVSELATIQVPATFSSGNKIKAFAVVRNNPTDTVGRTCAASPVEITC